MIQANHLHYHYKDGAQVLKDISFTLEPGNFLAILGNNGVGKSTLLNALCPELARDTGEISKKLGRGRHTTREVELFELAGGLVADTPGFAVGRTISADSAGCLACARKRVSG